MSGNDCVLHAERMKQRIGIRRELFEAELIMGGFARLAKSDLVGRDDTITFSVQRGDRLVHVALQKFFPCRSTMVQPFG